MKLYLMRHAEPEDGERMDPTRGLTNIGKKQAKMMGKWLDRQVSKNDVLIQSNFKRSQSTAKRVGKQIGVDPVTSGTLDPDGTPEQAWSAIQKLGAGHKAVVVVSHHPLIEKLTKYLTGAASDTHVHFPHAAVAHFEPHQAIQEAQGDYTYDEQEMKRWVLGGGGKSGENCETCEENADRGWVDMDDTFLSTDGDDIDTDPAHPNCTCDVEFKTKRVRVYENGRREVDGQQIEEAFPIRSQAGQQIMTLHSLVTPNVVARSEKEFKLVTHDSQNVVEAAIRYVEAVLESDAELPSSVELSA